MQKNVLEYLETTVLTHPGKLAFQGEASGLTFREVYQQARSVGSVLCRYRRAFVLVFLPKSPQMIVSFLGAAYSGNVYVPVDGDAQPRRLTRILQKLSPAAAVCDGKSAARLRGLGFAGEVYLYGDICETAVDEEALARVRAAQIDADPLYAVFTSGSTGEPKAVPASHRAVISYIDSLTDILGITEDTVFGNQVPLYLDACLKEVYSTLKRGATTYLIPTSLFMFPVNLIRYLNENKINTVCWVSSALAIISGLGALEAVKPETLRTVSFGSEVFPLKQFRVWLEALPEARFFNLYGPTEATGMSCYYEIDRNLAYDDAIPIGRAFPNVDVFLAGNGRRISEPDTPGTIHIRGAGVCAGYYDDAERTAASFVQNPLHNHTREIVYDTGDLGKYNSRGELVYLGRTDFQIKRHGYRVELMEIESAANDLPGVAAACCVYSASHDTIGLYYCGELEEKAFSSACRKVLPQYMWPGQAARLETLPKIDNHKIDRAALLRMMEEKLNG